MMDRERLLQDILDQIGDPRALAKEAETFDASIQAWNANYEAYRRQYLGQWIALYDGEVRAAADSLGSLLQRIDQMRLPRGTVYIQHPVADEPILNL